MCALTKCAYTRPFEKSVILCDESLEEIVSGCLKWLSAKQKDMCLAKRKPASEHGSPLIVRFPCDEFRTDSRRTIYFSGF